ncbi:MAG: threonine/serine exporter family protein [Flavobacteriales bacterium]|nr:threonine/serine exporter family protein [Flavobacteriales bacterium]MBP6696351.1 threonine/serine exporter family protein [Flavobacteriales bacterium]
MPQNATDRNTLIRFLSRLGQAELAAGNAVALVERDLGMIARVNGVEGFTASVLPTVLFLQLDDDRGNDVRMALGPYRTGDLRFDQIEGVLRIAREARAGEISPAEGLRRLDAMWSMKHRYLDIGFVFGYCLTVVGVALMLRSTPVGLAVSGTLGLLAGLLLMGVRRQPAWSAVMPVVMSFLLASIVAIAHRYGLQVPAIDLLIPPLVVFLPGSTLTIAVVELAFANMVSGASRLVAGFAQLILLAFGLLGGFQVFGGPTVIAPPAELDRLPIWIPWIGVLLFAAGLHVYKSSRPRSLFAMTLTMVMAYAGQALAGQFLQGSASAFFGAVLMTFTALTIEYRFKGPPAIVTFLPAFWLLAPGSFGLASVTGIAMDDQGTAENLLRFCFILAAIAMGCLIGAFVYSGIFHMRRSRWWSRQAPVRETGGRVDQGFPEGP